MNAKTAKLIGRYSALGLMATKRDNKRAWNRTPKRERHALRVEMLSRLKEAA
jgi:hypothetical protein